MSSRRRQALDWATIVLFGAALLAPSVDQIVRQDSARDSQAAERRKAEPRPGLPRSPRAAATFPRRYEGYFRDTFGLRDVLLRWNGIELWQGLGVSPSPFLDWAEQGWCFLAGDSRADHRGLLPFTAEELEGWVRRLRERRDVLATRGIRYLFVICPSKQTIYPERTRPTWSKVGPTRLEQLVARLEREPDAPFLDLRPALLAQKDADRPEDWLYTRFGTHWNGRGGYAAYGALIERLQRDFPALERVPLESCARVEAQGPSDSLAHQLYLSDRIQQRQYHFARAAPGYEVVERTPLPQGNRLVTRTSRTGPRLLWLHDSFGPYLESLLCENFSYVQAHWSTEFPLELVYEAQPDLVLETYVERVLFSEEPYRPLVVRDGAALFGHLTDVAWRSDAEFTGLHALGAAQLERDVDGLRLRRSGQAGGLLLPAVERRPGALALLGIQADCRGRVELDVYARVAGSLDAPVKVRARCTLEPGAGLTVVSLPDIGPEFEVVVTPPPRAKGLLFRSFEIRRAQVASR